MPSQFAADHLVARQMYRREIAPLTFESHEWELLTRLPARIMIAATSAEPDSDRRTVDEGIAGINAIAAGADSDSDLVKAIVGAIYAEADPNPPTAEQFRDPPHAIAEVLVSCRAAALVLDARATPADAVAYRGWLEAIADRVCGAARTGGLLGFGGVVRSPAEQNFLDELQLALRNV
ncbi:hypothetical protein [Catellatospora tritici]|uniref:hypothetical protein n=1 Tax=Catellatospora tritici TaxID=2851566 RepID=UPI0020C46231|nr:hypothetical protein [Catellatospora tritici]